MQASASSITTSQKVTLTATVTTGSPGAGTPDGGTVTFYDAGQEVGAAPLIAGVATLPPVSLPQGVNSLRAVYSDGGNYAPSNSTIDANCIITTAAGGGADSQDNGIAPTAVFLANPAGVAVDAAGDVFIADSSNNVIREISNGTSTTFAGGGTDSQDNGIAPTAASLNNPTAVAVDTAGNVFIADAGNHMIREVNALTGLVDILLTGNSSSNFTALATDAQGDLFIADEGNNVVEELAVGSSTPALVPTGSLSDFSALATDAQGDLFIADASNHGVAVVAELPAGGVTPVTVATGSSTNSYFTGLAADNQGDLFIADAGNNLIQKVNLSTGTTTVVAGGGTSVPGDGGPATAAALGYPMGLALDPAGDLFIADSSSNRVREIVNGVAVTVTPAPTATISLTSSNPDSAVYGQMITFTAEVTPLPGNTLPDDATVQFIIDGSDPIPEPPSTAVPTQPSRTSLPARTRSKRSTTAR